MSVNNIKSNNNNPNVNNGVTSSSRPKWLSHVKYEHLLAGICGGVASTLVLHPLDLLKVRLAVNDGQVAARPHYHGLVNAVTTIFKQEGIKGLYRGVTPNCWGAGASWGFYFLFYNTIKSRMTDGTTTALGPGRHILAAAEAGVLTLTITNPIWVVKTRLCLQYGTVAELQTLPASKRYSGMMDALRKVYQYEGVPGLYRGFVPGILGVSHGALQFMAYEELKKYYILKNKLEADAKLGTMAYLSCAALSKLFAASITYPYQVLRARLQDQHNSYTGVIDVIKKTWRFEGIKGYYKGLLPNLIKVVPTCAITFVTYEHCINYLLKSPKSV